MAGRKLMARSGILVAVGGALIAMSLPGAVANATVASSHGGSFIIRAGAHGSFTLIRRDPAAFRAAEAQILRTIATRGVGRPVRGVEAPAFSPTCQGKGCYNVDPVTQSNCSVDGYVVSGHTVTTSQDQGLGNINLMYQQYCNANWAEASSLSGGVYIEVFNTEGEQVPYQPNYNWGYTSMVDGSVSAGVCITDQYQNHSWCSAQPGSYPYSVIDSIFGATFFNSPNVTFHN